MLWGLAAGPRLGGIGWDARGPLRSLRRRGVFSDIAPKLCCNLHYSAPLPASDVLDGELRLGYLVPPDGPDASFAAAVRHWHAVGVESGVFKGDGAVEVPSLLLEQERLRQRRARLSGSRSRSRSRSQSVPRRREDDKTHVVPDAVAEEAAGAGKEEDGIAHRSTSGGTDDIANDSQTSTAKKGAEEVRGLWSGETG